MGGLGFPAHLVRVGGMVQEYVWSHHAAVRPGQGGMYKPAPVSRVSNDILGGHQLWVYHTVLQMEEGQMTGERRE